MENALLAVGLFGAMLALLEYGRRKSIGAPPDGNGGGAIEAAVFGLLGLLIAFTFSGAAGRFEDRRKLVTDEANAIGTALLRLDLLPAAPRAELRRALADYLEALLATHRHRGDDVAEQALWQQSDRLQARIWALALAGARGPEVAPHSLGLVLGPLNEAFDMAGKRKAARGSHPPAVTFLLLALLALVSSLLAGLGLGATRGHPRLYMVIFALSISGTFFVTRDMEHPREGLIRVDDADAPLIELRASLADEAR